MIVRANAQSGRWRELDLPGGYPFQIQWMLERGAPDVLLVAGRRSPDFAAKVRALERLRAAGVADPD